jgi:hypothetical protein
MPVSLEDGHCDARCALKISFQPGDPGLWPKEVDIRAACGMYICPAPFLLAGASLGKEKKPIRL